MFLAKYPMEILMRVYYQVMKNKKFVSLMLFLYNYEKVLKKELQKKYTPKIHHSYKLQIFHDYVLKLNNSFGCLPITSLIMASTYLHDL